MNEEQAGSPLRRRSFLGVLATAFTVALGFGLIVPALPIFARDLGASYTSTSAVVAVFAGVRLIASGPAGWLSDRFGARVVVASGLLIVSVSSALTAGAHSVLELIALRGMGGVGSALFITAMMQHVLLTIPAWQRGRAIATVQGAFLLGGASGPAVGGLVIAAFGIRAPFIVYALALLVGTGVSLTFLERAASGKAVAAGSPEEALGPVVAAPVRGRIGSGVVFSLLRDRTFLIALLLSAAVNWASQGMRFFAVPVFAEESLGADPAGIGLALTIASLAHAAVLYPASKVMDGRGRRVNARVGSAVYAVAVIGLVSVTGYGQLLFWLLLQGIATGIVSGAPAAIVGDIAPPEASGRAVGVLGIATDLGNVIGVQATGILADRVGFDAAFEVAAGLLLVAFVATLFARETLTARPDDQESPDPDGPRPPPDPGSPGTDAEDASSRSGRDDVGRK